MRVESTTTSVFQLSVILATHDPNPERFRRTVHALNSQLINPANWELIIVDNASSRHLPLEGVLRGCQAMRVIREDCVGLTHARLRGIAETRGDLVVFVDDDNVISPNYLQCAVALFRAHPELGAAGGCSLPEYEESPPQWMPAFAGMIGCRNLGGSLRIADWNDVAANSREYPACSPIGAGMVVRRAVLESYSKALSGDAARMALGRSGSSLASGEDNDIVLTALENGWAVGYSPELSLIHLIPAARTQRDYLARLCEASSRTWVQVLDAHGLRPWKAAPRGVVPLLKTRMYLRLRAWRAPDRYIRWRGYCGLVDGRSTLGARR